MQNFRFMAAKIHPLATVSANAKLGENVEVGPYAFIDDNVTIGDNSVIGAGSVVSRSIPANVVAVGVPCRVMRPITEEDKYRYPFYKGL